MGLWERLSWGVISGGTCSTSEQLQSWANYTYSLNTLYKHIPGQTWSPKGRLNHKTICACIKPMFTMEKLVYLLTPRLTVIPTQAIFPTKQVHTWPTQQVQCDKLIISDDVADHHPFSGITYTKGLKEYTYPQQRDGSNKYIIVVLRCTLSPIVFLPMKTEVMKPAYVVG